MRGFIFKSNQIGKSDHFLITVTSILKARKQRKRKLTILHGLTRRSARVLEKCCF